MHQYILGQQLYNKSREIITKVGHFACLQIANHNVILVCSDLNAAGNKNNRVSYRNHAVT